MRDLLDRQIIFVGGKGGVGKTTTAAALAIVASDHGRNCLVVSTDPAHSLSDIFARDVGDRETHLDDHLWALEIDPDAETDRHIATVKSNMRGLVHPEMYRLVDRHMDLARQAPGSLEAALLERVADLMAEARSRFDLVLFDTAPTGHTMRLLSLPEVMAAWTDGMLKRHRKSRHLGRVLKSLGGKKQDALSQIDDVGGREDRRTARINEMLTNRRHKFLQARELLLDRKHTAFVLVLTPEKLPILESEKAYKLLTRNDLTIAAVVVNRLLPENIEGDFFKTRRQQEEVYRREIDRLFREIPRYHVPLLPHDVHGPQALRRIGELLLGLEPVTDTRS